MEQGLAPSRERARALILAGEVLDGDRPVSKAGEPVAADAALRLRTEPMPYVSRGGLKLAHALSTFGIDVTGLVALDVGASTGGFTDCLLQAGAARVYCVDVGQGQLDWKIASDPRVVVVDRTNARYLTPGAAARAVRPGGDRCLLHLPAPGAAGRAAAAASGRLRSWRWSSRSSRSGESGWARVGIVRDETARAEALAAVADAARQLGLTVLGETPSPITGQKGNVEFLLYLRAPYVAILGSMVVLVTGQRGVHRVASGRAADALAATGSSGSTTSTRFYPRAGQGGEPAGPGAGDRASR